MTAAVEERELIRTQPLRDSVWRWDTRARALGDEQRIGSVRTRYTAVGFKLALMPVWISAYRYGDRVFRFLVNGQTGEVVGESPVA